MMSDLSLYIHIPFCASKCRYCDFDSFAGRQDLTGRYVRKLITEIYDRADELDCPTVKTIYIGGGTPSFINPSMIADIMRAVCDAYQVSEEAEISIEVNPGSADFDRLSIYRESGINRLSIGLQSALDSELALLGRIHTRDGFLSTYEDAVKSGFESINIDLIHSIPGQTAESYLQTLRFVCDLKPAHISAYSLQLEEGTYMYEHRDAYEWPDEDLDRKLYHMSGEWLEDAGYHRYEISNYSLEGYECRHNCVYWQGGDYLGMGLAAASYLDGRRLRNTDVIEEYLNGIRCVQETQLSRSDMMEEFMFLGLRMTGGVYGSDFMTRFGEDITDVYGSKIDTYIRDGLMERIGEDNYRLTSLGLDVSNYVFAGFLLEK